MTVVYFLFRICYHKLVVDGAAVGASPPPGMAVLAGARQSARRWARPGRWRWRRRRRCPCVSAGRGRSARRRVRPRRQRWRRQQRAP